jgi:hypothetical protein
MQWFVSKAFSDVFDRLDFLNKLNKASIPPERILMDKIGHIFYFNACKID